MASLSQSLPYTAFPHEVDELDITASAETRVELRYNGKTIFSSSLFPVDGRIELRDVASLLDSHLTAERYVCLAAARKAVPQLDLILTANGFGVVSNQNVAPASRERVGALIERLRIDESEAFDQLLDGLLQTDWAKSATAESYITSLLYCPSLMRRYGIKDEEGREVYYSEWQGLQNHLAVAEESTVNRGGGYFKRRVFTVFIVRRFKAGDMDSYEEALDTCRELMRQLHSKFIVDEQDLQNELVYLNVGNVKSRELGGQFLDSATGLYFTISMDEPIDLRYNAAEWDTTND